MKTTSALTWDERFAWHDAGLASTGGWVEPYPAVEQSKVEVCKITLHQLHEARQRLAAADRAGRSTGPGGVTR